MTNVTCKHSGIEFEAKTKRTTQHPDIAEAKAKANKRGNYSDLMTALDDVRNAGNYTTIDEYMTLVNECISGADESRREIQRSREAAKREAIERRDRENAQLEKHGYRWGYDLVQDEAYADDDRAPGKHWFVVSPDGQRMTKGEALAEIEIGAEITRAWDEAIVENKRRDEEAAKAQVQAEETAFYAAKDAALAGMTQVDRFDYSDFTMVARWHHVMTTRLVYAGTINGVQCAVTETVGDGDYHSFYSADPQVAGLTVKASIIDIDEDYDWAFE